MAQEQNSTNTYKTSEKKTSKPHFKQQNTASSVPNRKPTQVTSHSAKGGAGRKQTRDEKRKRWAKKHKVVAKPVVKRGPVKEYITACCSLPGIKPRAAQKDMAKDPESGKMKETVKGLGHWRCSSCGKLAKVTPRKPVAVEAPKGNMAGQEIAPYPGPLTTPEVTNVSGN